MEVSFDTTILLNELKAFHTDAVRRMENMVQGFAYELSLRAIENTPLGDSVLFERYYLARTDLPQVEGIAKGNWQYSNNGSFTVQRIAGQGSGSAALDIVLTKAETYKLGETFYIGNAAPYIGALEGNYSHQTNGVGIMQPTISDITGAYSVDLKYYYNKG